MAQRKRYCQVGLGGRSGMYTDGIWKEYAQVAELVGLCDTNQARMDLANSKRPAGLPAIPTFLAGDFERMIAQCKPDAVIVTSMDVTHDHYIIRAMELGCDVVTEKPMTIDDARCRAILDAIERTGRQIQVTFNYRYSPPRSQLKQLLMEGVIGDVLSVDFTWLLNTHHGADYFRRWHRNRQNSGSLLVHKATHHFDLVNWWLGAWPEEVSAFGSLRYYTPRMGDQLGLQGRGERCHGCPVSSQCKYHLDLAKVGHLKEMYLDAEHCDGYFRDQCIFSEKINIWDTMVANVRYSNGALMSYCLMAYSPWEGYRISFTGTKGRLEHTCVESTYINGDGSIPGELSQGQTSITLIPSWEKPRAIEVWTAAGGHGGGDGPLVEAVFSPNLPPDPLHRRAGHVDGTYSVLTGVAAYRSIDTGQSVKIGDLLGPWGKKLQTDRTK